MKAAGVAAAVANAEGKPLPTHLSAGTAVDVGHVTVISPVQADWMRAQVDGQVTEMASEITESCVPVNVTLRAVNKTDMYGAHFVSQRRGSSAALQRTERVDNAASIDVVVDVGSGATAGSSGQHPRFTYGLHRRCSMSKGASPDGHVNGEKEENVNSLAPSEIAKTLNRTMSTHKNFIIEALLM